MADTMTPVVGADGREVLADDCACGHTRNWHVNPKYECDVSGCLCATFTKPVKLPPPAQQPAGPDVDTAAIRAENALDNQWESETIVALCDALDARDVEIRELRAETARLREELADVRRSFGAPRAWREDRDREIADARARLDEIRALCDERDGCVTEHTRFLIRDIRAVLDRPEADRG